MLTTVRCAPHELRLVIAELQAVGLHPVSDGGDVIITREAYNIDSDNTKKEIKQEKLSSTGNYIGLNDLTDKDVKNVTE